MIPEQEAVVAVTVVPRPVDHSILWGVEIFQALFYNAVLMFSSFAAFFISALATMFCLEQMNAISNSYSGKLIGAVAATGGIWFILAGISLTIADICNNMNHYKAIRCKAYYNFLKVNNIDFCRLASAFDRIIVTLASNIIASGVFAYYAFSLNSAELAAFLLIISLDSVLSYGLTKTTAKLATFFYQKTDSFRQSNYTTLHAVSALYLAEAGLAPAPTIGSMTVIPITASDMPHHPPAVDEAHVFHTSQLQGLAQTDSRALLLDTAHSPGEAYFASSNPYR